MKPITLGPLDLDFVGEPLSVQRLWTVFGLALALMAGVLGYEYRLIMKNVEVLSGFGARLDMSLVQSHQLLHKEVFETYTEYDILREQTEVVERKQIQDSMRALRLDMREEIAQLKTQLTDNTHSVLTEIERLRADLKIQ